MKKLFLSALFLCFCASFVSAQNASASIERAVTQQNLAQLRMKDRADVNYKQTLTKWLKGDIEHFYSYRPYVRWEISEEAINECWAAAQKAGFTMDLSGAEAGRIYYETKKVEEKPGVEGYTEHYLGIKGTNVILLSIKKYPGYEQSSLPNKIDVYYSLTYCPSVKGASRAALLGKLSKLPRLLPGER